MKTKTKKAVRWDIIGQQIVRDCGGLVCKVGGDFYDDGQRDPNGWTFDPPLDTKANAALIAAAPELADACLEAQYLLGRVVPTNVKQRAAIRNVIRLCEAALAKAERGSKC